MIQENDPSQLLKNEHKIIVQTESIILAMDGLWEKDAEKYAGMVKQLLHFFREYSDRYHHFKEESILFQEMRNHPDFMLSEIIDELEDHHVAFREYAREIAERLEEKEFKKSQLLIEKYIHQLLDHIAVEDDEFFIMADTLFSDVELEKLYFRFKDVDRALGEEAKKELEKIPGELQRALQMMTT
ncbi:MAG: hemerythrin domain-containing protein [bacterium]|nr:hemerythrin domain-containing protein [bacterium]